MNLNNKGKLIVIDGIDGSGKATQTKLLCDRLTSSGVRVYKGAFPNYESKSSTLVKMYLAGEIGDNNQVNPYTASTFYSADRAITYLNQWKDVYNSGTTIITDRYTTANIVHQMPRLPKEQWQEFIDWLFDFEYNKLAIPKPDVTIYLDMHPNTSQKLLSNRYQGDESKKDMLEKDVEYMLKCRQGALFAGEKLGWTIIKCCDGENPYTQEEIQQKIQDTIAPHL